MDNEYLHCSQDLVRISHHMFYLTDHGCFPQLFAAPLNGLIAIEPGAAVIYVGASGGVVRVFTEPRIEPADKLLVDQWENIVEASMEATGGHVTVAAGMDSAPDLPVLTLLGAGPYRVRVHSRGRDRAPDLVATQPQEEYYIVVWPSPLARDTVNKATDRYGAELSRSARHAHRVTPPTEGAEAERRKLALNKLRGHSRRFRDK